MKSSFINDVAFDVLFSGYPAYNTPVATSMSKPPQTNIECTNFCTPMANLPSTKKRQGSKIAPNALPASKKSSSQLTTMQLPTKGLLINLKVNFANFLLFMHIPILVHKIF